MQFFWSFFRKKSLSEADQLLALAMQLRQINNNRNMDTDDRLRMVSSIADQASAVMKNSKKESAVLLHN
ncbi:MULTISPECIES: hypothetical protein [unclassified Paenibacillus]|uniref:hypothetical protein n=1 Tax=unclassified Paenibacillus TaxID=185978 RepID=UPI0027864BC5|nr:MULTISPECIES: hypothetical protein [unclassified Paenibacillus]MDQ0896396.1 hypothetical protein [Paenibacillus sp. V4I7]MDQ0914060.1 hypothetical protein [Paenibacillus sp. V4I5]